MSTIILNGSPKGNNGNSEIFINQFLKGMKIPCDVKYIVKENPKTLAEYVKDFDTIIFVLPLYIHSMPGVTMRFIECLEPAEPSENKSIGFIVQGGFPEASQYKYAERYFSSLSKELNRAYLGTVIKGGSANVSTMSSFMTKKLFKSLERLGEIYEQTHTFDKSIIEDLKNPREFTGFSLKIMKFITKTGLINQMWDKPLKQNGVFDKNLDKPFLGKN
ncbi:NAD(P)H-dependent oxidoreductase [Clostridium sp. MSJ-11]|uniref:NAD(P)H-dependent oxidoreductase n=1 Tax=Clostridium mobile TaxID=2841512 RepID=A0ABS6EJA1_9CLOT|nr:NAD(P)H-dependent oxidoreductase [Clostridium mobile]MBU5484479.1 NAD(P)H-dependent oxidoreductase [Clostridium mobile]